MHFIHFDRAGNGVVAAFAARRKEGETGEEKKRP